MAKDDRGTGNPNHPHVRVGVVGSRRRKDSGSVYDLVESLPKNSVVVSGGCWGPDTWAVDRAKHETLEPAALVLGLKKPVHAQQGGEQKGRP